MPPTPYCLKTLEILILGGETYRNLWEIVFFQLKGPQNASAHITRSANFRKLHHLNIAQNKEQSTAVTMLKTALVKGIAKGQKISKKNVVLDSSKK